MSFLELAGTTVQPVTATEGFWPSFGIGLLMMLVAEIGDKTFICAAVFGVTKNHFATIAGVQAIMILMILVSLVSGDVITDIAGAGWVNVAAIVCFGLYFLMYVREAWHYTEPVHASGLDESLTEYPRVNLDPPPGEKFPSSKYPKLMEWLEVFWKVAVITFFAEWADRTQFSVYTLSKEYDHVGLGFGSWVGQGICTAIAVFVTRYITDKITKRRLLILGALVFLGLGFYIYFWNPGKKFVGKK